MIGWSLADWRDAYRKGASPRQLLHTLLLDLPDGDPAWISRCSATALDVQLEELAVRLARHGDQKAALPLYGVPFAVKDNIDVAGMATTAACPAFSYLPAEDAFVVARLRDAGAIPLGKSNLDQFATGLSGTRSPYGIVPNSFDASFVSGGSSSGSASLVARGVVPFALATDTAGSGRVPAGLNNIVGLKPTRGRLSNTGLVPACRSLDCISVLARNIEDAAEVCELATAYDVADSYSRSVPAILPVQRLARRPRLAVPANPEFFGDAAAAAAWSEALAQLAAQDAVCVPVDTRVLDEIAALLYQGPWVAERYASIERFIEASPEAMHPVVRDIIQEAHRHSAVDAFRAGYRLAGLRREAEALLADVDALVVPTAPVHVRIEDMLANPIELNTRLGRYTNFVNLLDWSAVSMPAVLRNDGLPFGVTLVAPAWHEDALCEFVGRMQARAGLAPGAPMLQQAARAASSVKLAVVGAHLSGMPLNHQLTSRAGRLLMQTTTSPRYRLFALPDTVPPKPGLHRCEDGSPIVVEIWELPLVNFGAFVNEVPPPLGIGNIELADGSWVKGFICEAHALAGARDITGMGGWRAFVASSSSEPVA